MIGRVGGSTQGLPHGISCWMKGPVRLTSVSCTVSCTWAACLHLSALHANMTAVQHAC